MKINLPFSQLQMTCQSLGAFAEARSKPFPDKDLILTVKKINGQEVLQTARLSDMTWFGRMIRWFGFFAEGTDLQSVASFLQDNELYTPSFSTLKQSKNLSKFLKEDVMKITALKKDEWKLLKHQNQQGCEIFKRCVSHHNEKHRCKIYCNLNEEWKKDLRSEGKYEKGGIKHSWPNPMGYFPNQKGKNLHERYRVPFIDIKEFGYVNPVVLNATLPCEKVLGFCLEYGLGTKKDKEKAIENYLQAIRKNEYSAFYNLARLRLENNQFQEAINLLLNAEKILLEKIDNCQRHADHLIKSQNALDQDNLQKFLNNPIQNPLQIERMRERSETGRKKLGKVLENYHFHINLWVKDLKKVYSVLIEAYDRVQDLKNKNIYEGRTKKIDIKF